MSKIMEHIPAREARIYTDIEVLKTKFQNFEKSQSLVLTLCGLNFFGVLITILAIVIKVF